MKARHRLHEPSPTAAGRRLAEVRAEEQTLGLLPNRQCADATPTLPEVHFLPCLLATVRSVVDSPGSRDAGLSPESCWPRDGKFVVFVISLLPRAPIRGSLRFPAPWPRPRMVAPEASWKGERQISEGGRRCLDGGKLIWGMVFGEDDIWKGEKEIEEMRNPGGQENL